MIEQSFTPNLREKLDYRIQSFAHTLLSNLWLVVGLTLLAFWVDGNYILSRGEISLVFLALVKSFVRDLVGAVVLVGFLGLLPRKVSVWGRWCCFAFASVLYWYECILFKQSNLLHGYVSLQSAGGTNSREAMEYLGSIQWSNLGFPLVVYLIVLVCCFCCNRLIVRCLASLRYPIKSDPSRSPFPRLFRQFSYVLGVVFGACLGGVMFLQFKHYSWAREEAQIFIDASSPVERLVWNTYGYLCDASQIALRMDKLSSVDVGGIEIDEAYRLLPSEANLVIVVGESLGRRYMHSYGYPLPNTPRLDSLIANGDMLRYTDVAHLVGQLVR